MLLCEPRGTRRVDDKYLITSYCNGTRVNEAMLCNKSESKRIDIGNTIREGEVDRLALGEANCSTQLKTLVCDTPKSYKHAQKRSPWLLILGLHISSSTTKPNGPNATAVQNLSSKKKDCL